MTETISLSEAGKLNDERIKELVEELNKANASADEIGRQLAEVWQEIAKNIDYNL